QHLLALEWFLLFALAMRNWMARYENRRPGARHLSKLCMIGVALAFGLALWLAPNTQSGIAQAVLEVVELLYVALVACWSAVIILGWVACCASRLAVDAVRGCHGYSDQVRYDAALRRARRTVFTARLAFSLQVAFGLVVTLTLYSALYAAAVQLLPAMFYRPLFPTFFPRLPVPAWTAEVQPAGPEAAEFLKNLITSSGSVAFAALLALLLIAMLLLAWGLLPVVFAEVFPPQVKAKAQAKAASADSTPDPNPLSQQYGEWLNNGYRLARVAGELIFVAVAIILASGGAAERWSNPHYATWALRLTMAVTVILACWALLPVVWQELQDWGAIRGQSDTQLLPTLQRIGWFLLLLAPAVVFACLYPSLRSLTYDLLLNLGKVVVGSAIGLAAFRGKLESLALGFRPVLDVLLDVESHLRPYPAKATVRAQIGARYASLLRYLCRVERPDDPCPWGYDAIIIVAHSQGTVITADLLRFLKCQPDPELHKLRATPDGLQPRGNPEDAIPIFLFTMGCPLRQLYGLRFPNLYGWARHADHDEWTVTHQPPQAAVFRPPHIPDTQEPDPKQLAGVVVWANAFRSGDYIGRHLWRSDLCAYAWRSSLEQGATGSMADTDPDLPRLMSADKDEVRREFCIGPGAHTHYWDSTAPTIAAYLDLLVQEAISCAPRRLSASPRGKRLASSDRHSRAPS
ncbi:MAG: hypothetical protein M3347_17835, partial [Armatimonadota bacterium]|nr:hypothetical protein [Armatimonadota bacterium]